MSLPIYVTTSPLGCCLPSKGDAQKISEKENPMLSIKNITLSAAIVVATALSLASSVAFANAPGGSYVQCDGGKSSPVRCAPDSW
jgi:hypothetical protein